jgi:hypothetical protein
MSRDGQGCGLANSGDVRFGEGIDDASVQRIFRTDHSEVRLIKRAKSTIAARSW